MSRLLIPSVGIYQETDLLEQRRRLGILAGFAGLAANLMISAVKISAAIATRSVSISADSVHNLADASACIVTLVGFLIATKSADNEHPYGYGRMEYICAFGVAIFILLAALETAYASIRRLLHPVPASCSVTTLVGLGLSIAISVGLCQFNTRLNTMVHSIALEVAATDYLADAGMTALTMLSLLFSGCIWFPVDGIIGLLLSALVCYIGWRGAQKSVRQLLGAKPDPVLMTTIAEIAQSVDGIVGIHNLVIHDYGPTAIFASFHANVDSTDIENAHAIICRAQDEIYNRVHAETTIHLDLQPQT